MKEIKVSDQYRKNHLSLKPGGHTVKVIHEFGMSFVYDKIKFPGSYVHNLNQKPTEHGDIVEVLVNDKLVWNRESGRKIWDLDI